MEHPGGTVVLDSGGYAWQFSDGEGWWLAGMGHMCLQYDHLEREYGPLTVVHTPAPETAE